MAEHGVNINEIPSGAKPPVRITAGIPVYTGTAPINAGDPTCVNKAIVAYTLAEAEAKLGPQTDDFANWTLHEAIKAHFLVYEVAPVVFINVIDPENPAHVASVTGESHQLVAGEVQLQVYGGPDAPLLGVIESSVVVKEGVTTRTLGTDYTLAFDDDGYLVVSVVEGGALAETDIILVDFDYLDPTGVTADDIIAGLDIAKKVYPSLRLVPGFLVAPKWSQTPEVASRMQVLAHALGAFRCSALIDLSSDPGDIASYAEAPAWKADNGYTAVDGIACWPKAKNGDDVYHGSTVIACVANVTDADHEGIPYASPSNKAVSMTAAVLDDGTEVLLEEAEANSLNKQGIVTFLNGFFGWRTWGNRTAGYPGTTDPKDAFIPIRRMFNWIGNTIKLTTNRDVDEPGNKRLIQRVNGTHSSFLNGLVALGALVAGSIEFRSDDNPVQNLSDGIIVWHLDLTPPSPGEALSFTLEYDASALAALFT